MKYPCSFIYANAETIAIPIAKQMRNVPIKKPSQTRSFSQTFLIDFITNRLVTPKAPLIPPPIAPPTIGTIEQSATLLPQTKIKTKMDMEQTSSYHFAGGVTETVVFSITNFVPVKKLPLIDT